jgi:hypothetical protein
LIDKTDGNFLGSLFFNKVGDTKIFLGTYPLRADDIKRMRKAGITGVLNLQTDLDIEQRGIPWEHLKGMYKENRIKTYRFPVNDDNEDDFCSTLFVGA